MYKKEFNAKSLPLSLSLSSCKIFVYVLTYSVFLCKVEQIMKSKFEMFILGDHLQHLS